jgi:membrane-associated protease RseP (regulator of RpoE activity)
VKTNLNLHIFLAFATFITLTFQDATLILLFIPEKIGELFLSGLPYSLSLMVILFSHEMGHYFSAQFHGVRATLPYFIPMPFGPVGTMGAVIKILEPIPDKKKLFDIGIGGPLMSFLLSVPCWIYGVYLSEVVDLPESTSTENILIFGDSVFTYWTTYLIHGELGAGRDILIHPLAKAGWVGLLVTAINLLPFGQLDGGHIIYALFGEKYRDWIYFMFFAFLFLGFIHFSWVIWGFLIYFLIKVEHPFVPDTHEELDWKRKLLGSFMLISLVFIFVPVPIATVYELKSTKLYEDILNFFFGASLLWNVN